jgi:hypothetical protein
MENHMGQLVCSSYDSPSALDLWLVLLDQGLKSAGSEFEDLVLVRGCEGLQNAQPNR